MADTKSVSSNCSVENETICVEYNDDPVEQFQWRFREALGPKTGMLTRKSTKHHSLVESAVDTRENAGSVAGNEKDGIT